MAYKALGKMQFPVICSRFRQNNQRSPESQHFLAITHTKKLEDGRYKERSQQQAAWTTISFQTKLEDTTKKQSQQTEGISQRQDH